MSGLDRSTLEKNCRIQNHGSWLMLKLAKMNLSDDEVSRVVLPFLGTLLENEDGKELWASIDLSENPLTSNGCTQLLDALRKHSLRLKTLKLYKCQLTDTAGIALAHFIAEQKEPIQEMHLSHNLLTAVSFVALLCAMHRHGGYPHGQQKQIPLWARLEYNQIARPSDILKMVEQELGVRCCLASDRDSCGPWRCVVTGTKPTPMIHMFAISVQKPSPMKSDCDVMKLITRFMPNRANEAASLRPESKVPRESCKPSSVPRENAWTRKNGSECAEVPVPVECPVASVKSESSPSHPVIPEPIRPKCNSISDLDLTQLHYRVENSSLLLQCVGCKEYYSKDAESVRMVLAMNCSHVFCSDCFAAAVRSNIDTADIKCGSKQVPCPTCQTLMKRSEAAVLEEEDWNTLSDKANNSNEGKEVAVTKVKQEGRIFKEQIEALDPLCAVSFLCHFCDAIGLDPLVTACSHVFCKVCFQNWVDEEVRQYKSEHPTTVNVPAVPCPQPGCEKKLRKQDVGTLDSSDPGNKSETSVGLTMIRRMHNNLQVRCLHHPAHYSLPFGATAKKLSSEITCSWVGDLHEYTLHIEKCKVENAEKTKLCRRNKRRKEIRKALYSFLAEGEGQLTLKVGDLVEVLETCEAGWGAGRLVDSRGTVLSDAGWFPMTFLIPLTAGH